MKKKTVTTPLLCTIIILVSLQFFSASPVCVLADQTVVKTIDDVYVSSSNPTTNYDAENLYVGNTTSLGIARTLLKFNVTQLATGSYTLKLYARSTSTAKDITLYSVTDDSWTEETVTWDTAPPLGTALATSSTGGETGWISFESSALTDYINEQKSGDGIASFYVVYDSANEGEYSKFWDKENEYTLCPRIESSPLPSPTETSLSPIDDVYISSKVPTYQSDGDYLYLGYHTDTGTMRILLKFNVSALIPGSSYQLRLRIISTSGSYPVTLYSLTNDSWTEETVTWDTAPSWDDVLDTENMGDYQDGEWLVFQSQALTDYINEQKSGDGIASFYVVCDHGLHQFYDKENSPTLSPKILSALSVTINGRFLDGSVFKTNVNGTWMSDEGTISFNASIGTAQTFLIYNIPPYYNDSLPFAILGADSYEPYMLGMYWIARVNVGTSERTLTVLHSRAVYRQVSQDGYTLMEILQAYPQIESATKRLTYAYYDEVNFRLDVIVSGTGFSIIKVIPPIKDEIPLQPLYVLERGNVVPKVDNYDTLRTSTTSCWFFDEYPAGNASLPAVYVKTRLHSSVKVQIYFGGPWYPSQKLPPQKEESPYCASPPSLPSVPDVKEITSLDLSAISKFFNEFLNYILWWLRCTRCLCLLLIFLTIASILAYLYEKAE